MGYWLTRLSLQIKVTNFNFLDWSHVSLEKP